MFCRYAYPEARACPVVNARLFRSAHAFLKREKLSVGVEGERWVEGLRGVKREREGGKGRDREVEKAGRERVRGREGGRGEVGESVGVRGRDSEGRRE